jgi:asparagine synthase (glutamine-hydrolysing)
MISDDGRYVIAFNGEIYNHQQLRARLISEGQVSNWRGNSDTETILAAIAAWGIQKSIGLSVGMFALALFDKKERSLTLIRDRMGEKPLYYGYIENSLYVSSEIKALYKVAQGNLDLNADALASYMRLGYTSGEQSIFTNIRKLPPGSFVKFSPTDIDSFNVPQPEKYWDVESIYHQKKRSGGAPDLEDAIDQLDVILGEAISNQMISDVPLGALLSGGIDSSLIVSLMQHRTKSRVNTFSIGFRGAAVDEAPFAKEIAAYLGTSHTECYFEAEDALQLIPDLPKIFCEPFSDTSQLPTLLVSKMARQKVTVALTGDGGDELFAGYDRYSRVVNWYGRLQRIPISSRIAFAKWINNIPSAALRLFSSPLTPTLGLSNPADRILKLLPLITSQDPSSFNRALVTNWIPKEVMLVKTETDTVYDLPLPQARTLIEQLMLADMLTYLPDDLLVKVDRASMAYGLECRSPFLDHRLVEFALGLPEAHKISSNQGKVILRKLLGRYLPRPLFDRPKQGFGAPVGDWLRGPLRQWAQDSIHSSSRIYDYIDKNQVISTLNEHLSGKRNWDQKIWTILMLLNWHNSYPKNGI